MVKTRIAVLSAAFLVACFAAAFWARYALDRIRPEDEVFPAYARWSSGPRAPVESLDGRTGDLPTMGDVRSVEALVKRLRAAHDPASGADWAELCALADAAVELGRAAVEPMGRLAEAEDEPIGLRLLAVDILGRIPDESAVPHLMECLSARRQEALRLAALAALGQHPVALERIPYVFADLVRFDAKPGVRARAADLVGRTGGADSTKLLCGAARRDQSPEVRRHAASALGVLLDEESVATLRDAALMDRDADVRVAAVEALGNFLDPRMLQFFKSIEASDESPAVQAACRRQLWRIPAE